MTVSEFLLSEQFPYRLLKRPLQLYRYARTFENWPAALKAARANTPSTFTYRLRNDRKLIVEPNSDRGIPGEVLICEPYSPARQITDALEIWDIGANIGAFVVWASQYWPKARYLSFEPCSESYATLLANRQANSELNWQTFSFGISDSDRTVTARIPNGAHAIASIFAQDGRPTPFILRDINKVWEEHGRPKIDIFKVDCEGGEYALFNGISNEMLANVRFIILEVHPVLGQTSQSVQQKLERANFETSWSDKSVATVWALNRNWPS